MPVSCFLCAIAPAAPSCLYPVYVCVCVCVHVPAIANIMSYDDRIVSCAPNAIPSNTECTHNAIANNTAVAKCSLGPLDIIKTSKCPQPSSESDGWLRSGGRGCSWLCRPGWLPCMCAVALPLPSCPLVLCTAPLWLCVLLSGHGLLRGTCGDTCAYRAAGF